LLNRPEMLERLRRDPSDSIPGVDPTPETAAARLACLAVLQAGRWGEPYGPVKIDHPRFEEAVEAAAAADDDKQAVEDATAILEGPEALEAFGLS
jgi:hypothetical protein